VQSGELGDFLAKFLFFSTFTKEASTFKSDDETIQQ
jgi:hypothetical protein